MGSPEKAKGKGEEVGGRRQEAEELQCQKSMRCFLCQRLLPFLAISIAFINELPRILFFLRPALSASCLLPSAFCLLPFYLFFLISTKYLPFSKLSAMDNIP
jgi:hypothetical protein